MQLVILAAGHGTRYGGLKQLAPVGPHDEAIMDYTVAAAESSGFGGIVLVVRDEIREQMAHHIAVHWPASLAVAMVFQPPVPGTAQAVAAAAPVLHGPFGVVNADDLYGEAALRAVHDHFRGPGAEGIGDDSHVLVAYQLVRTVLTDAAVKRGLLESGDDGLLVRIAEHSVSLLDDGSFVAVPLGTHEPPEKPEPRIVPGSARVSMNLWGFHPRILGMLDDALAAFDPGPEGRELLLPQVIGDLVATGADHVRVVDTEAHCIGVTHTEDVAIVRAELAETADDLAPTRGSSGT